MNLNTKEYVENVLRTESNDFEAIRKRLNNLSFLARFGKALHAAVFVGNLVDDAKKHIFYGKSLPDKDTYSPESFDVQQGLSAVKSVENETTIRLLHAAMGMVTESVEFLDAIRAHLINGEGLDKVNLEEEMGDLAYYLGIAANALGHSSLDSAMEKNIAKLRARYGEKFSSDAALNRDTVKELAVFQE